MILTTLTTLTIPNPNLAADQRHFIIPSYSPFPRPRGVDTVFRIVLHLVALEACLLPRFAELGQYKAQAEFDRDARTRLANLVALHHQQPGQAPTFPGTSWFTHRKCPGRESRHRRAGVVLKYGSVGVSGLNEGRDSLVLPVVSYLDGASALRLVGL